MAEKHIKKTEDTIGYIHSHETFGSVDGPGIRYVFFLQGCPLRCIYCHNPDSVPCMGGDKWTAHRAANEVLRYRSFIKSGGVTFSGGEPLIQAEFVASVSELLRQEGIHVAIDTAGSEDPLRVKKALDLADLILLDIKGFDPETCRFVSGKDNKNAFATLDYCEKTNKPVWVRHVLLRNVTLIEDELTSMADYLKPYKCIQRIELLPFHKMGEHKWEAMSRMYTLSAVEPTTEDETAWAKEIFIKRGFTVQ